jgi:N-acetylmuramoyl-L-alanine amidase
MFEAAVLCLALNVYYEARGEPIKGQHMVAQVTMNRAGWNKRKVCKVVKAEYQFSWTNNQNFDGMNAWQMRDQMKPSGECWNRAQRIARATLRAGKLAPHLDFGKGSTHFHSVAVKPMWVASATKTSQIGRHIFYKL